MADNRTMRKITKRKLERRRKYHRDRTYAKFDAELNSKKEIKE